MRSVIAGMLALVLVSGVLFGCGTGSSETRLPAGTGGASSVKKAEGIRVSLSSEPEDVKPGVVLSLSLDVRNLSGSDRSFELPTSQVYEFVAFAVNGGEVWRWSSGVFFARAVTSVTLAPGENKVFKVAWDTSGRPPGRYRVEGYFLGTDALKPTVGVVVSP